MRQCTSQRAVILLSSAFFVAQLAPSQSAPAAADNTRFDGKWQTTVSCEPARGALGFSYRFPSEIKAGSFHGLHGTEGDPGYLLVEGTIDADGSASLYAKGKTNGREYVPGRDVTPGTDYGYHIKAKFTQKDGTGSRVEGRPCSYEFERK